MLNKAKESRKYVAKASWIDFGAHRIYVRSLVEGKVARCLQNFLEGQKIKNWEYEPQTFWFESIKRGVRSYKPDFKVTLLDDTHFWIEVKGYMDAKSKTKLKRFSKYFPEENFIIVNSNNYLKIAIILQNGGPFEKVT